MAAGLPARKSPDSPSDISLTAAYNSKEPLPENWPDDPETVAKVEEWERKMAHMPNWGSTYSNSNHPPTWERPIENRNDKRLAQQCGVAKPYMLEVFRGIFVRWMFESSHASRAAAEDEGRRLFSWTQYRVVECPELKAYIKVTVPPAIW